MIQSLSVLDFHNTKPTIYDGWSIKKLVEDKSY